MTDQLSTTVRTRDMSDLELITSYLNGQLDTAQEATVRQRLEHDSAFQELAAPLLFVWSIPPAWKATPRPAADAERMWNDFTRRARFVAHRRKVRRRRLWIVAILLAAIGVSVAASRDIIGDRWVEVTRFDPVPDSGHEMQLRDSSHVTLLGGRVRVAKRGDSGAVDGIQLRLRGSARFRLDPRFRNGAAVPHALSVVTPTAFVGTGSGIFTVTTRGDTTFVEVMPRAAAVRQPGLPPNVVREISDVVIFASRSDPSSQLLLQVGEAAMLVAGERPRMVRAHVALDVPPMPSGGGSSPFPASVALLPGGVLRTTKLVPSWETHMIQAVPQAIPLGNGITARLAAHSMLRAPVQTDPGQLFIIQLRGDAAFIIPPRLRSRGPVPISVQTSSAVFYTENADFAASARGDTTDLEVLQSDGADDPTVTMSGVNDLVRVLRLQRGQRARSVSGVAPVVIPR